MSGVLFFNQSENSKLFLNSWRNSIFFADNYLAADDQVIDMLFNVRNYKPKVDYVWLRERETIGFSEFDSDSSVLHLGKRNKVYKNTTVYFLQVSTKRISPPPNSYIENGRYLPNWLMLGDDCGEYFYYKADKQSDVNRIRLVMSWAGKDIVEYVPKDSGAVFNCKKTRIFFKHLKSITVNSIELRYILDPTTTHVKFFMQNPEFKAKINYQGCYHDFHHSPNIMQVKDLSFLAASSNENCPEFCSEQCREYQYFGLQDKQECWCDNQYGKIGRAHESDCEPCEMFPESKCGGPWRNSVYSRDVKKFESIEKYQRKIRPDRVIVREAINMKGLIPSQFYTLFMEITGDPRGVVLEEVRFEYNETFSKASPMYINDFTFLKF
jgi:hypothetical protein